MTPHIGRPPDTCTARGTGSPSRWDAQNKLEGKVQADGDFSGRYVSSAGKFKVSGHVEGQKATVNSTESGTYNPASNTQPNKCQGSHTFHAALTGG